MNWVAVDFKFLDAVALFEIGWWFYDNSPHMDWLE